MYSECFELHREPKRGFSAEAIYAECRARQRHAVAGTTLKGTQRTEKTRDEDDLHVWDFDPKVAIATGGGRPGGSWHCSRTPGTTS